MKTDNLSKLLSDAAAFKSQPSGETVLDAVVIFSDGEFPTFTEGPLPVRTDVL